ncbi:MAG: DUF565 domain-containing protein [Limnothrix sp.]
MQRTRLNTLFDESAIRFSQFFRNPWRKFALYIIALLFGNFIGTVVPTTAGQRAAWDPIVGAAMLMFTELVSRIYYKRPQFLRSTTTADPNLNGQFAFELLNTFKIGLIYGLIVEALELGS